MTDFTIPTDILNDLSSRFIINIPEKEKKDHIRVCFQIELAHWFYLDFYCTEENSKLKSCGMKEFTTNIFRHIPYLKPHVPTVDATLDQWKEYKHHVPSYGAIILNDDLTKVLLVQSYWTRRNWGFPKGKINEDEDPSHCAVREVLEETGFDISNLIDKNEYMESFINDQLVRLYIISGVQTDTKFQPKTRKEIKNVEWFDLEHLPNNKKDMTPKVKMGFRPNSFFLVIPFVKRMKRWVQEKQQKEKYAHTTQAKRNRYKSVGDVESNFKSKQQQQFVSTNEAADNKFSRQVNTSSIPNPSRLYEYKNRSSTGAFKRNLFGKQGVHSPANLAKQIVDSPLRTKSNLVPKDTPCQVIKCSENMKSGAKEKKADSSSKSNYGKARKVTNEETNSTQCASQTNKDSFSTFDFRTQVWMNFKFDCKSIKLMGNEEKKIMTLV